ncbi:chitinase-like protein PB1E7.04c isoform X2 [Quillaja saponaria]|uniref:Chitinase-like protein PB1E7.04c isoform X2 n=1 Tax=Quillaja saponaria TaxID=32244 RepID=A0AAD7VEA1_QUISA|nr:chitinase-like protein PB1E7.04c isoform X2 [Quillaja saponaria]
MEGYGRNMDVQSRRLSLIDVSSEDDSLILSSTGNLIDHQYSENQEHIELLDGLNTNNSEDTADYLEDREQVHKSTETFEIGRAKKNRKYNLRKSLAWDSAFFTSAGVLEPEELSSIIECVEKGKKCVLPRIQEDAHRSCESISTLESDTLTLESFEADLLEDVRASIQKSGNMSKVANGSSKVLSRATEIQSGISSKRVDSDSLYKMKSNPASKNPSATMRGSGTISKKDSICSLVSQKSVAASGESSLLKQPKLLGKSSPSSITSTKRASFGDLHVKTGKDNARPVTGRVSSVSKTPALGVSRSTVPKPTLLSKPPSGSSAATRKKLTTSSLSGGSSSDKLIPLTKLSSGSSAARRTKSTTSTVSDRRSDNVGKSPSHSLKRSADAGKGNPPSSCSSLKTPSRNKTQSGSSSLTACLKSVNKLFSNTSPASSISEWSSESSSTTCKQRSNSSITSLDSSSCRKVSLDSDASQASDYQNPGIDQCLEGHESQVTGFRSGGVKNAPAGNVLPPVPTKPSGLRMPSPKIGFFDGVKSVVCTPRPHVPGGMTKTGAGNISPRGGENKAKLGKLQPARSVRATKNTKSDNQPISLTMKPKCLTPCQGLPKAAVRTCGVSRKVKSSSIPTEAQSNMPLKTGAGYSKTENTITEGHDVGGHDPDLCSALNDRILDVSVDKLSPELKGSIQSKDIRANPADGENNKGVSSPACNVEDAFTSQIVKEGATFGQFPLKAEDTLTGHDIGISYTSAGSVQNGTSDSIMDKVSPRIKGSMNSLDIRATPTDNEHNSSVLSSTYSIQNASLFQVVEEGLKCGQHNLLNDLNPINDTTDQENSHYEDQFDILSRQNGVLDITTQTHKEVIDDELPDCQQKEQSLNKPLTPLPVLSPTIFDMPGFRRPFTAKDSFCNMDGLFNVTTGSTVAELKTSTSPLLDSILKEN